MGTIPPCLSRMIFFALSNRSVNSSCLALNSLFFAADVPDMRCRNQGRLCIAQHVFALNLRFQLEGLKKKKKDVSLATGCER